MGKHSKRTVAWLLTLIMAVVFVPSVSFAADSSQAESQAVKAAVNAPAQLGEDDEDYEDLDGEDYDDLDDEDLDDDDLDDEDLDDEPEFDGVFTAKFANAPETSIMPGSEDNFEDLEITYTEPDNPDYDINEDYIHYFEGDFDYDCVKVDYEIKNITGDVDRQYIELDGGPDGTYINIDSECGLGSFELEASVYNDMTNDLVATASETVKVVDEMYVLDVAGDYKDIDAGRFVPGQTIGYKAVLTKVRLKDDDVVMTKADGADVTCDFEEPAKAEGIFEIQPGEEDFTWTVTANRDAQATYDEDDYPEIVNNLDFTATVNGEKVSVNDLSILLYDNIFRAVPKKAAVKKYLGSTVSASSLVTIKYYDRDHLQGITKKQYQAEGLSTKGTVFSLSDKYIKCFISSVDRHYMKVNKGGKSLTIKSKGNFYLATPDPTEVAVLVTASRGKVYFGSVTNATIDVACKHKSAKSHAGKAATFNTEGRAKYYECKACHDIFSDSKMKKPVANLEELTIPCIKENSVKLVDANNYVYSGKAKKPHAYVEDVNGKVLTEGKDYTITYKNNVNASTNELMAKATIKFKGKYSGSATRHFTIDKADQKLAAKAPASIDCGKTATLKITGAKGRISVDTDNDNVTIKLVKGVYKIKGAWFGSTRIYVKAAGNSNYNPAETYLDIDINEVQ